MKHGVELRLSGYDNIKLQELVCIYVLSMELSFGATD